MCKLVDCRVSFWGRQILLGVCPARTYQPEASVLDNRGMRLDILHIAPVKWLNEYTGTVCKPNYVSKLHKSQSACFLKDTKKLLCLESFSMKLKLNVVPTVSFQLSDLHDFFFFPGGRQF